jgi:hypothetical protein
VIEVFHETHAHETAAPFNYWSIFMWTSHRHFNRPARTALFVFLTALGALAHAGHLTDGPIADQKPSVSAPALRPDLAVGDVVFIRVAAKPFREVAAATNSWTNHVGIVVGMEGKEPLIGESTFPFSRTTRLSKFIARSESGRYAVARLKTELSPDQQQAVALAAKRRNGIFYDTGFDLHSRRQFCSRYVREVLAEATGVQVGEVQTFADLLQQQPGVDLSFWKVWYFGNIPWDRATVSPASVLHSPQLQLVFDSAAVAPSVLTAPTAPTARNI